MFAVVTDQRMPRPETARCHVHAGPLFTPGHHVEDCSEDFALVCQVCGMSRHNEMDPMYLDRPIFDAYLEDLT
ncbi:hypothetical protein ABIB29_003857 [Arthrobacter sp. UYEF36]